MNNTIIYRPYKVYRWALPFTVIIGVLSFAVSGCCAPYWGCGVLIPVAIGLMCLWLTRKMYNASNMAVFLEPEGLRLVGGRFDDYRYVCWEEVSNAYYARTFRGFMFLVLSPKSLNSNEVKRLVNRGAHSSKLCIDDAIVIYIDSQQEDIRIKEHIDKYVSHVRNY